MTSRRGIRCAIVPARRADCDRLTVRAPYRGTADGRRGTVRGTPVESTRGSSGATAHWGRRHRRPPEIRSVTWSQPSVVDLHRTHWSPVLAGQLHLDFRLLRSEPHLGALVLLVQPEALGRRRRDHFRLSVGASGDDRAARACDDLGGRFGGGAAEVDVDTGADAGAERATARAGSTWSGVRGSCPAPRMPLPIAPTALIPTIVATTTVPVHASAARVGPVRRVMGTACRRPG